MNENTEIIVAHEKSIKPSPVPSPELSKRLSQAMGKVKAVALDGNNTFHHYRYPTIAQVRARAGEALAEAGITLIPSVTRIGRTARTTDKGKTTNVTVVELAITISSPDGSCVVNWVGESEDLTDKSVPKALSAAMKSFLLNLLLIPVGEEENDDDQAQRGRPAMHWIDNPKVRARFWRWTREELGLSDEQVYEALGVERVHDYSGTMQDAKEQILDWIEAQVESEPESTSLPEEMSE